VLAARGNDAFQDLADFCCRTRLLRPPVGDPIRAGVLDGCPAVSGMVEEL
jgi:hypothetical protein